MIHKPINIKKAEQLYQKLRGIRQDATMDNMNLDPCVKGNPLTQTVLKATEQWRNTSLVSPLDEVLEQIKEACGFNY